MIFVAHRYVVQLDGDRVPVAWNTDGEPLFKDDMPRVFEIETFPDEEYDGVLR